MIHFGLMHTIRKYTDIRKLCERLKEDKTKYEGNEEI